MPDTHTIIRLSSQPQTSVFPFCQPGFLFNELRHVQQQGTQPFCTIGALNETTRQIDARCTFFTTSAGGISPLAAPFGSVEFAPTLPDPVLRDLITTLIAEVRSAGKQSLRLVHYPHCYAPEQTERLTTLLLQQDFHVAETYSNFHLPITGRPFEQTISAAERRRLYKCQRSGFRFEHWTIPDPTIITSFIADMRRRQQYQLSLSPSHLTDLLKRFANEFPVFAVTDGPVIAALSVTVRVREDILYNFLPVSNPDYATFSPMVMLVNGLFTHCQQRHIRLLDLGVALDGDHRPKPSLIRFKQNMGAQESPKLVFDRTV